jgi:hypothetical protein
LILDRWFFIGMSFDQAGSAGAKGQVYVGSEDAPAHACAFGTTTDSDYVSNSGAVFHAAGTADGFGFGGMLGDAAQQLVWPHRVLTFNDMLRQQFERDPVVGGCQLSTIYHDGPNKAWDRTGFNNHGNIVQPAFPVLHEPAHLRPRTGRRKWFDVAASAAAFNPAWALGANHLISGGGAR